MTLPTTKQSIYLNSPDWDVLLVLDACRYDVFAERIKHFNIRGIVCEVDSEAYQTIQWYKKHWSRTHHGHVLVTPHPMVKGHLLWKHFYDWVYMDADAPSWIYPEPTMQKVPEIQAQFSDKQIVVHTLPPHLPFLGQKGRYFLESQGLYDYQKLKIRDGINLSDHLNGFGANGGWAKLREFYTENVDVALECVQKWLPFLCGKIAITADHGDALGDGGHYAHGPKIESLRSVPWMEVEREASVVPNGPDKTVIRA